MTAHRKAAGIRLPVLQGIVPISVAQLPAEVIAGMVSVGLRRSHQEARRKASALKIAIGVGGQIEEAPAWTGHCDSSKVSTTLYIVLGPDHGGHMPTYVMLSTWTDQGMRQVKDSPDRL